MNPTTIKLTVAALGGQGGGVLSSWLIDIAESEGYLVQSTSVPGVAQRTGATIYYLEFFPRDAAGRAGRNPVMALMPTPGDVDCVVAAELVEAGRALMRGLVTPDRTTLIASSHRDYSIAERSALGSGITDSAQILELVRAQAKRSVVFHMAAVAARHGSMISAVLLGAIGGTGVLPFTKDTFEAAIRRSGLAVATNLAAFDDAWQVASKGGELAAPAVKAGFPADIPDRAPTPALQALLDRVRTLAAPLQPIVLAGVRRQLDYQDVAYAQLYLDRVERVVTLEGQLEPGHWALSDSVARGLALWMSFEDTIRIADLKTRGERFARVRQEIGLKPDEWPDVVEFLHPRVHEIAGTMPASWGRWLLGSPGASRFFARFTGGRQVRTSAVSGFLMLRLVAGLRRIRRRTLRYAIENEHIERWLEAVERIAPRNLALAVEVARLQRLVKGYGDTHERGERNFTALLALADDLVARADGPAVLARLHDAALADEEGVALSRELSAVGAQRTPVVTSAR